MLVQGVVGQATSASQSPGTSPSMRQGQLSDVIVSELQGRFYEATYRGAMFSTGMSAVALSANTIALTSTSTPILGVYNPSTSSVNLVILQAFLTYWANTYTTPASPGSFLWAASTGNAAVSTGLTPWNRKTLAQSGSQAKGFAGSTALTGLTNNVVVFEGAHFISPGSLAYGTITAGANVPIANNANTGNGGVQNFDGSLIVPPGAVLSLVNTTSSTTFSVAGALLWAEVPV